jgi:DnaJ-class molecular chaperone
MTSRTTIRVSCPVCDGLGETVDDRGIFVVCHGCLGHGYHDETPEPVAPAPEPAVEVWAGEDGAP